MVDLRVTLGRLALKNPVLVASGTFGYVREMAGFVRLERLGGVIPKTVTFRPRAGNPTPRTVETASGLLNAIGLDNDGIDHFREHHLPYLRTVGTAVIANIAGEDEDQFVAMAEMLGREPGLAAIELNISCPNVSHGLDLGIDAEAVGRLVRRVRAACPLPIIAKLTPNVTDIVPIAAAAAEAGADAVSLVNTFRGMAVDWRRRRPILANDVGGLTRPGDQADRPADGLGGRPGPARLPDHRHRRHRHGRRRPRVPGRRRLGRPGRHRHLLRPARLRAPARRPHPPARRQPACATSARSSARSGRTGIEVARPGPRQGRPPMPPGHARAGGREATWGDPGHLALRCASSWSQLIHLKADLAADLRPSPVRSGARRLGLVAAGIVADGRQGRHEPGIDLDLPVGRGRAEPQIIGVHEGDQVADGPFLAVVELRRNAFMLGSPSSRFRLDIVVK